jgi:hypothetical protein
MGVSIPAESVEWGPDERIFGLELKTFFIFDFIFIYINRGFRRGPERY